jgi:FtsH-binding integral membrane protein
MSVKNAALVDAFWIFVSMLAVHFGWNLLATRKISLWQIFFVSTIVAIFMYFYKRKDLFD